MDSTWRTGCQFGNMARKTHTLDTPSLHMSWMGIITIANGWYLESYLLIFWFLLSFPSVFVVFELFTLSLFDRGFWDTKLFGSLLILVMQLCVSGAKTNPITVFNGWDYVKHFVDQGMRLISLSGCSLGVIGLSVVILVFCWILRYSSPYWLISFFS